MQTPKPQRSNFDLISGMILGGLLVGSLFPVANKYLNQDEHKGKFSLKAKAPISAEVKKKDRKTLASANVEAAPINAKTSETLADDSSEEALKKEAPKLEPTKSKPSKTEAKDTNKVELKKRAEAKRLEKSAPLTKKKNPKTSAVQESSKLGTAFVSPKSPETNELVELQTPQSADQIAQKSDLSLTENRIENLAPGERFVVINNLQYTKDQLSQCPKRCLLRSVDNKGQKINAVISGPAFAEALKDHEGTINLTGIKRNVRGSEIFLVQSITYNLPGAQRTAEFSKAGEVGASAKSKPIQRTNSDWEDLRDDVKIR